MEIQLAFNEILCCGGKNGELLDVGVMEDGSLKEINIDGHEIVLAKVNGRYYAADSRCHIWVVTWTWVP